MFERSRTTVRPGRDLGWQETGSHRWAFKRDNGTVASLFEGHLAPVGSFAPFGALTSRRLVSRGDAQLSGPFLLFACHPKAICISAADAKTARSGRA